MFCENCGANIDADSKFCDNCGAKINSGGMVQTQNSAAANTAAPYGYQQQPKKSKTGVIVIYTVLGILIAVGGYFLWRNNDNTGGGITPPPQSNVLNREPTPSPEAGTVPSQPSPETSSPQGDSQQGNSQQELLPPPDVPPPDVPQPSNNFADYRGYEAGEYPSSDDFLWYYNDVMWDGLPANRTVLSDFSDIAGYWKAYTEETAMAQGGYGTYMRWFNAEISGDANQAVFTYHADGFYEFDTTINSQGEFYDISYLDGNKLQGFFVNGVFTGASAEFTGWEIRIDDFYALGDGSQYAIGEINYISGEREFILLVRP